MLRASFLSKVSDTVFMLPQATSSAHSSVSSPMPCLKLSSSVSDRVKARHTAKLSAQSTASSLDNNGCMLICFLQCVPSGAQAFVRLFNPGVLSFSCV